MLSYPRGSPEKDRCFEHVWGPWYQQPLFAFRERECTKCDAVEAEPLPVGEERC